MEQLLGETYWMADWINNTIRSTWNEVQKGNAQSDKYRFTGAEQIPEYCGCNIQGGCKLKDGVKAASPFHNEANQ